MKKVEIHKDAVIAIIVVFIFSFSFILYQRYQYSDLLQENVDLTWDNANLQANLDFNIAELDECRKVKSSGLKTGLNSPQTGVGD